MTSTAAPHLVRSDSWILATLFESRGKWKHMHTVVHNGDWLNRDILSYDEISYGIPRLISAGYVEVSRDKKGRLVVAPTKRGSKAASSFRRPAKSLGDVLAGFALALGCEPYPKPEVEDRSLGRLDGFTKSDYDVALARYYEWWKDPFGFKRAAKKVRRKA